MKAGVVIALFFAVIAFVVAITFLPIIGIFTAENNTNLMESLNSTGFNAPPFAPIMHLWPVWSIILIIIGVAIIFVGMSKRHYLPVPALQ